SPRGGIRGPSGSARSRPGAPRCRHAAPGPAHRPGSCSARAGCTSYGDLAVHGAELASGGGQLPARSLRRALQRASDLRVAEPGEVAQQQRLTPLKGKGHERALHRVHPAGDVSAAELRLEGGTAATPQPRGPVGPRRESLAGATGPGHRAVEGSGTVEANPRRRVLGGMEDACRGQLDGGVGVTDEMGCVRDEFVEMLGDELRELATGGWDVCCDVNHESTRGWLVASRQHTRLWRTAVKIARPTLRAR